MVVFVQPSGNEKPLSPWIKYHGSYTDVARLKKKKSGFYAGFYIASRSSETIRIFFKKILKYI